MRFGRVFVLHFAVGAGGTTFCYYIGWQDNKYLSELISLSQTSCQQSIANFATTATLTYGNKNLGMGQHGMIIEYVVRQVHGQVQFIFSEDDYILLR